MTRLRGPERDLQDRCDLRERHLLKPVQHEHRTRFGVERVEHPIEQGTSLVLLKELLGRRRHGVEVARACVRAFLDGEFSGGRHVPRIEKISRIEAEEARG